MTDVMKFDSARLVEVPVEIEGKSYVLREASGEAACMYRDAMLEKSSFTAEGTPNIKINPRIEPLLVSLCMFEAETNEPVSLDVVLAWPNRIVKALHKRAMEISDLSEKEAPKGNAPQPMSGQNETQDGSNSQTGNSQD